MEEWVVEASNDQDTWYEIMKGRSPSFPILDHLAWPQFRYWRWRSVQRTPPNGKEE